LLLKSEPPIPGLAHLRRTQRGAPKLGKRGSTWSTTPSSVWRRAGTGHERGKPSCVGNFARYDGSGVSTKPLMVKGLLGGGCSRTRTCDPLIKSYRENLSSQRGLAKRTLIPRCCKPLHCIGPRRPLPNRFSGHCRPPGDPMTTTADKALEACVATPEHLRSATRPKPRRAPSPKPGHVLAQLRLPAADNGAAR